MIPVPFEVFIVGFTSGGILLFTVLWLYYDRRDKIYYDQQRLRHVYHCVKCGKVYTSRNVTREAICPGCGFTNASLRF